MNSQHEYSRVLAMEAQRSRHSHVCFNQHFLLHIEHQLVHVSVCAHQVCFSFRSTDISSQTYRTYYARCNCEDAKCLLVPLPGKASSSDKDTGQHCFLVLTEIISCRERASWAAAIPQHEKINSRNTELNRGSKLILK